MCRVEPLLSLARYYLFGTNEYRNLILVSENKFRKMPRHADGGRVDLTRRERQILDVLYRAGEATVA